MMGLENLSEKIKVRVLVSFLILAFISIIPIGLTLEIRLFWLTGFFILLFFVCIFVFKTHKNDNTRKIIEWVEPRNFLKLKYELEYKNRDKLDAIEAKHIFLFSVVFLIILIGWYGNDKQLFNTNIPFSIAVVISLLISILSVLFLEFMASLQSIIRLGDHHLVIERSGENPKVYDLYNYQSFSVLSDRYRNRQYCAIQLNGEKRKVFFLDDNINLNEVITFLMQCDLKHL